MEVILAIAIGILGGSGVWLVLRPRTFQVLMGLSLGYWWLGNLAQGVLLTSLAVLLHLRMG